jgi:hypothetical protein
MGTGASFNSQVELIIHGLHQADTKSLVMAVRLTKVQLNCQEATIHFRAGKHIIELKRPISIVTN